MGTYFSFLSTAPNDLGVRKGVMKLHGTDEMPTPTQVKNLPEKWHPLETVGSPCLACAGV